MSLFKDFGAILEKIGIGASISVHEPVKWNCHYKVDKYWGEVEEQWARGENPTPYEVTEGDGNLLTTLGANDLWTALCTSGGLTSSFAYTTTNAQVGVGDGSTAAAAGDSDIQSATNTAVGGAITGVTNVQNFVVTTTSAHGLSVGQVVTIASVVGAVGANGTWEISAVTSNTYTVINAGSAPGAYSSGGTTTSNNKIRQVATSVTVTASQNNVVIVATFGTTKANYVWNNWGILNMAATNQPQGAISGSNHLLNHAVINLGTKTNAASWTITITLSLS